MTDPRSELAVKILQANPHAYELLVVEGGTPAMARELLEHVKAQELLDSPLASADAKQTALAAIWLWHDGLDECHRIVQGSPQDPKMAGTFAYWHAIMHRREGDFSNCKYWYARTGTHPAQGMMAA